ncbi:MAG: histone deacetylase family protein [Pseudomonadota bacterium]
MKTAPTAYYSHPDCALHEGADGHPEFPLRTAAISGRLKRTGTLEKVDALQPSQASSRALALAHRSAHVEHIYAVDAAAEPVMLDWDTSMNAHSLRAALLAAGAVLEATDRVIDGKATNAFCNVRPPGHHAEAARAMGFCLFNNVAVAARHAVEVRGLKRVAIVDFDVHHGNGTEDIFRDDPRVMFCSSFQYPWYPNVLTPSVDGHLCNVPLTAGTDGRGFRDAIAATWLPQLIAFKPELIFVSAGFDAHAADPLGQLELDEDDFAWITDEMMGLARRYASGRLVSTLEGGYDLDALAASALSHVERLLDH